MATDHVYVATQSGAAEIDGETYMFTRGSTRVREGHPLLAAAPACFERDDVHVHYDIEQATAAPGEKRKRASGPTPVED